MSLTKYIFSKKAIVLGIVLFWICSGANLLLADQQPNLKIGGPIFTVDNQTNYTMNFTVRFPNYDTSFLGSLSSLTDEFANNYQSITVSVFPKKTAELSFISDGHIFWFGVPGAISETLIARSDSWPSDQRISVTLKKITEGGYEYVQNSYSYGITPFMKTDTIHGKTVTPRINWNLNWNNNGWKMILTQDEARTSFVPVGTPDDIWD